MLRPIIAVALFSAAPLALAQEKKIPTENFQAQCIGCHGIPGYKTSFPAVYHVPRIAGQQPGYIISALKARYGFASGSGERNSTRFVFGIFE